jgi:8-oxo-dGTP diphosphatase
VPVSVDVVVLTPRGGRLAVLLTSGEGGRGRRQLPWVWASPDEALDATALRVTRAILAALPDAPAARGRAAAPWLEQVRAYDARLRHPGDAAMSVAFVALVPPTDRRAVGSAERDGWRDVHALPPLAPRHRAMVEDALAALRDRLDVAPVAFHLLPPAFTLSQLQEVYEMLLGRPLHKASFRRALQGASLVRPLDEWRTTGRGRPAQLYQFAPRRRRRVRRGARFDLLTGE